MERKRRKLDRSAFRQPPPPPPPCTEASSAGVSASQPVIPVGEAFLPVDENSQKIKAFSWLDTASPIFNQLERQKKYLCSAYILVDWIEALYRQKHGVRVKVSLQELVDNADPAQEDFDYAYNMNEALRWISMNGISLEQDYETIFEKQPPQPRKQNANVIGIKDVKRLKPSEKQVLNLLKKSPLPARLRYDGETYYQLQLERGNGIYRLKKAHYGRVDMFGFCKQHMDHAVLIIGWGTDENGVNYYEVRDANREGAPNNGHYRVVRPSSVREDEIEPIAFVLSGNIE